MSSTEETALEALEQIAAEMATVAKDNSIFPQISGGTLAVWRGLLSRAITALRTPAVQGERIQAALRVAGQMADEVNGVDLHEVAYAIYVARTGTDDGDPSEDDYAAAFVEAALHTPTESER